MIQSDCFSRSWIKELKEKHPSGDPLLIERMIHAFELLGELTKREDNFVFKGGTALVLLLDNPRRVSIDIDITGDIPLDTLEKIKEDSVFVDFHEDKRSSSNVPKSHYEFVYGSAWDGESHSVLMDYIEDENVYPETDDPEIDSEFFEVSEALEVTVPGIEGLLADKLIAFAPETVGIPYRQSDSDHTNSLRLIKQLHDVGILFDEITDASALHRAYPLIHEKQCEYVGTEFSMDESLEDTLHVSELVSLINSNQRENNEEMEILETGIQQIQGHLLTSKMTLDQASLYAARTAYLATFMMEGNEGKLEKYEEIQAPELLKDVHLEGRFEDLNYLKGRSPEAFYYWWRVSEML